MVKNVSKNKKGEKLYLYERKKPNGQSDGFGWHTPNGASTLRKKGYKLKRSYK